MRYACELTIWLAVAAVGPALTASPTALEELVDSVASEAVESGSTPGVSVGVAEGDRILVAKGYGLADVELSVPATAETVYRIGSITKQFTAAAILLLVQEEKLSLDDPLTRFLPDYPTQGHTITLRHLLQHTSGIKSFTNMPSHHREIRKDLSHEEIIGRFKDVPLNFAPGEAFRYCNSGYYLLGVVVEEASGQTYADVLAERLFGPLTLERTCYDSHARIIPNRAKGYARVAGKLTNADYVSMTQPFAAGALASTVGDLIAWQRALVTNRLLAAESYKAMTKPGKLNSGKPISYGLGLFVRKLDGRTAIRHGGGIKGFRSELAYFPHGDFTIAVLANGESARPQRLADRIARHLFEDGEKP